MKKVSVVLGSYNRKSFLKSTIASVRKELEDLKDSGGSEIIVIDGGSSDGSVKWLSKQKDIILILQHNRGIWKGKEITRRSWGYFMNLGFKASQGKYVCMLSDDCLVVPGAIRNGIIFFEKELEQKKKIGALAFYWRNWPIDEEYFVGVTLGDKMFVNHGLYLRSALAEVDYLDEENYFFYHGDGDVCLKLARAGYACLASPQSFIEHYADANAKVRETNNAKQKQDWQNYLTKWKSDYPLTDSSPWVKLSFKDKTNEANNFKPLYYIDMAKKLTKPSYYKIIIKKLLKKFFKPEAPIESAR